MTIANDWTFTRKLLQGTRGGSTSGVSVNIDESISNSWKSLKEVNISDFERDRRAVLALQGEFKVSFEFLETILLDTKLKKDVPYFSWGTEYVDLIEDSGNFISLQHIMVLYSKDLRTGEVLGPFVVKHWRQDWEWETSSKMSFQGDNHWEVEQLNSTSTTGKWKWSVFQVDDTPRYSSLGRWKHLKSTSIYTTEMFTRPLPRREFSVRSDYNVLLASDTIVLTANSWFHEQRNLKHQGKLGNNNDISSGKILSREVGHNSYLRISGFNFEAGHNYWNKTKTYWASVRSFWKYFLASNDSYKIKNKVNGITLYSNHFKNAEDRGILNLSESKRAELISKLISQYIIK
jgi:hypothetical protein